MNISSMSSTTTKVKLYSYARFSSNLQKHGDSIHRQLTLAEEFVATHPHLNLQLVNAYQDDGVSGHKGRNVSVGRLGEFLKDVKAGRVEKNSWIGFEDIDRLSRQNYLDAEDVFKQLVNSGITVAIFKTGKYFDRQSLRDSPYEFIGILLSMVSANEYVERMSTRALAVWKSKREAAVATGKIMSANVPAWITTVVDEVSSTGKPIKQHFELNDEKSVIIRKLVSLFMNGLGCQSLATKFNTENVACIRKGKYWAPANVRAILNNEALCGRYAHKGIVIESYVPPLISRADFDELQQLLKSGNNSKLRKDPTLANALQGVCRCSECNSILTRVSQRAYRGRKAYEKLVCIAAKQGKHKYRAIEVNRVTGALFMLLEFPTAFNPDDHDAMTPLQAKLADIDRKIENVTNAIAKVGLSDALQRSLKTLEGERASVVKLIEDEASKAVYGNAKRIAERTVEARAALKGKTDASGVNASLRRLFKSVKIDIEAGEIFAEWLDGRVSTLTV